MANNFKTASLEDIFLGKVSEDTIRSWAAAPSKEEDETCLCGRNLADQHPECYSHMTQGY